MKIVFWVSLIGIVYTYAGYPIAIWMVARLRPRRWKTSPITPSVSIVLAVHNGLARLPQKIRHLLSLDYANLKEVIIVSDGSRDGTAELLAHQQHSLLKAVILKEHAGKAVALNAGVAQATGDVILFVDVRPEIAPGAIQRLVSNFSDPSVGCVAGKLILRQDGHSAASASIGGLYWRYEQWIRECEATVDSPLGVYGGFYAVRRNLVALQPVGMILDDMFQPLSIVRMGYRSVVDEDALVYDVWPKKTHEEFHRKVRTLAGNFQLFKLAPWTLTPQNRLFVQLISHKVMRLVLPYLFVLLLASSIGLSSSSRIYAGLAIFQILSWGMAALGLKFTFFGLNRIAGPAAAMLTLNAAAVVALHKFLFFREPLWKIWNPSQPTEMRQPATGAGSQEPMTASSVSSGQQ